MKKRLDVYFEEKKLNSNGLKLYILSYTKDGTDHTLLTSEQDMIEEKMKELRGEYNIEPCLPEREIRPAEAGLIVAALCD